MRQLEKASIQIKVPNGPSGHRGLSLIECVVGLALLGGAVLVVMGLFPAAYSSMVQARETTAATQFATGLLNRCRSQDFFDIAAITNGKVTFSHQVEGTPSSVEMTYALDVARASGVNKNLYAEVTVTVSWTSNGPKQHRVSMSTVVLNQ